MGAPYSLDLRERVVGAVASGMSRRAAAALYQVGISTAIRWVERADATGSPAALPMGGQKPFKLADEAEWINARVAAKPDITGRELLAELQERNIEISYYGVWNFLDHQGLTFKKKRCTPANKTALMSRGGAGNGVKYKTRSTPSD